MNNQLSTPPKRHSSRIAVHTLQMRYIFTMKELLDQYDECPLECDGLTRVLTTVLTQEGIGHTCFVGSVVNTRTNTGSNLHLWVELADGWTVDYRARMWMGESKDIPHGIFNKADYPDVWYLGQETIITPLSPALFEALTMKNPFEDFFKDNPKSAV